MSVSASFARLGLFGNSLDLGAAASRLFLLARRGYGIHVRMWTGTEFKAAMIFRATPLAYLVQQVYCLRKCVTNMPEALGIPSRSGEAKC